MAIAFDAITSSGFKSGTANTQTHTATGSDLLAVIAIYSTIDNVTSVTYAGNSCTFINKLLMTGAAAGQYIHLYYYLAPPTSSQTVQVNSSTALNGYFSIATYSGVEQTGQPDANNTGGASSTSSQSVSVTTTDDNCWLIGYAYTGNTMSAGTGTTLRGGSVAGILNVIDSNSPTTPAGSDSLIVTQTASFAGMVMASFSPAVAGGAVSPQFKGFARL